MAIKRSAGITFFAYVMIIPGAIILVFNSITLFAGFIVHQYDVIISNIFLFFIVSVIGIVCVTCGVGLLKLKKWGLNLFVYFSVGGILYGLYGICYKLYTPIRDNEIWIVVNILLVLSWIFAILFFKIKKIANQFH